MFNDSDFTVTCHLLHQCKLNAVKTHNIINTCKVKSLACSVSSHDINNPHFFHCSYTLQLHYNALVRTESMFSEQNYFTLLFSWRTTLDFNKKHLKNYIAIPNNLQIDMQTPCREGFILQSSMLLWLRNTENVCFES